MNKRKVGKIQIGLGIIFIIITVAGILYGINYMRNNVNSAFETFDIDKTDFGGASNESKLTAVTFSAEMIMAQKVLNVQFYSWLIVGSVIIVALSSILILEGIINISEQK